MDILNLLKMGISIYINVVDNDIFCEVYIDLLGCFVIF